VLWWDWYEFNKKRVRTCNAKFVFSHPVGFGGHIVHSIASGARNVDELFFKIRQAWCSFHKKHTGKSYSEHGFLHLLGSAGHVVHSGASGPQNIDALFFMLGWDRYGFDKQATGHVTLNVGFCICWDPGTCSAFRRVRGVKHQCTIFHARVRPMWFPKKPCQHTLQ
jgi:hypothetical protein